MGNGFTTRSLRSARFLRHRRNHQRLIPLLRVLLRWPAALIGGGAASLRKLRRPGRRVSRLKLGLLGLAVVIAYFGVVWFTLPDITDPRNLIASQSTVITDRNGIELYRLFSEEDRTFVSGDKIPLYMKQATIAIEDERFYERGCLDIRAIARAVFLLGRAGGGSTITRQLARNALDLSKENRYQRKLKEFVLGCQLEARYGKEELLELYLNWIPFGQNAYGIEQASRVYFDSAAAELSLAQAAILAALPQRPSYFSPYGHYIHTEVTDAVHEAVIKGKLTKASQIDASDMTIGLLGGHAGTGSTLLYVGGRTDQVLRNMQELEFITEAERLAALADIETITFQPSRENIRAPHFVLSVRDQVLQILGETSEDHLLERGGLRIETTLDWELQKRAEDVIAQHWDFLSQKFGMQNVALVAMDPATKEVLVYVGNVDYDDEAHGGKIDMAVAPRQPGSSFKPFVYASAFQRGFGPATPIWDVPTKIGDDEPQNFDGKFTGLLTIRKALGASRNIPAAKAYFLAGEEDEILALVAALGAPTPLKNKESLDLERPEGFDYGWPLALGAAETPLMEMVSAYTTIARGGKTRPVVTIRKITDKSGNLLYAPPEAEDGEVLDERVAYQVTSVLSDESARPHEYWRTQLTVPGFATAAKTGTSNKCLEWRDVPVISPEGAVRNPNATQRVCRLRKPDNGWVIGYTPMIAAGVWIGNADSSSMYEKADGLSTGSPIWRDFMISVHRTFENPKAAFNVPEGIITVQISELSGQLPTVCTPVRFRKADIFLEERPPTEPDPACAQLTVDRVTGLLASDACPRDAAESGSFLVAESILADRWPDWQKGVDSFVTEQMTLWNATENHSGSLLLLPVAPTEKCDPSLTPGRLEKPSLQILSPSQGGTASYPTFRPRIHIAAKATIREVRYAIDSLEIAAVPAHPFTQILRVPRSIQKDGMHTLSVTAVDAYFNEVTESVRFTFDDDRTNPTVRIVLPSGDITIAQGETLSARAEAEDEGGIKYVQFHLGDTLLSTQPKEPYAVTYKIVEPPGTYELRAVATDLAGNIAERSVEVTVK